MLDSEFKQALVSPYLFLGDSFDHVVCQARIELTSVGFKPFVGRNDRIGADLEIHCKCFLRLVVVLISSGTWLWSMLCGLRLRQWRSKHGHGRASVLGHEFSETG